MKIFKNTFFIYFTNITIIIKKAFFILIFAGLFERAKARPNFSDSL